MAAVGGKGRSCSEAAAGVVAEVVVQPVITIVRWFVLEWL